MPACLPGPRPAPATAPVALEEDEEERVGLLSASIDETAVLPADLGQGGFDVVPEGEHVLSASAQAKKAKTP